MDGYALYLYLVRRYVGLLIDSSSGTSTLTTVLGTESSRGLLYLKGMPNVCVRHLGLLDSSESSRFHLLFLPKCDVSHLVELP